MMYQLPDVVERVDILDTVCGVMVGGFSNRTQITPWM